LSSFCNTRAVSRRDGVTDRLALWILKKWEQCAEHLRCLLITSPQALSVDTRIQTKAWWVLDIWPKSRRDGVNQVGHVDVYAVQYSAFNETYNAHKVDLW